MYFNYQSTVMFDILVRNYEIIQNNVHPFEPLDYIYDLLLKNGQYIIAKDVINQN